MSEISKEVSYLKGLTEGMNLAEKSDEGKLIQKMIDVLSEAADEIETLCARNSELETRLDEVEYEIYSNGMDIENLYDGVDALMDRDGFGDPNFDDFGDYDDFDDDDDSDFLDLYDDDDDLFEIMCPECGEDVVVDFDMLDEENNIVCPNCHREIELEFDMDEDDE